MKISDAALLLDGLSRYFTDVYKAFDYADGADLRDYLEFVIHEPTEWMRGFPAKWKSAATFYRPRAAFHKLLKHSAVIADLGTEYCDHVDDVLWRSFKEDGPKILMKRSGANATASEADAEVIAYVTDKPLLEIIDETTSIASEESRHSVRRVKKENIIISTVSQEQTDGGKWQLKFEVLYSAYLALLGNESVPSEGVRGWSDSPEADRLRKSATLLVTALRSSF